MESDLLHAIFTEGAPLYRDIRQWRLRWTEELRGHDGTLNEAPQTPGCVRSERQSVPLHVYYPFLFHTLFPEIERESIRELALADRLYTEHLLSYDRILDQQMPTHTTGLFLSHMEHMQSLKRLYALFPVGHPFWDYFSDCACETWKNVREERLHHSHRIGAYPIARFCTLAKGKTALLKPFSVALTFLARRPACTHRLSASLDQHHIALVLIDDLEDWRQDFLNSNFTFLLTRLIRKAGLTEAVRSGRAVSVTHIGRLLYGTGQMEKQLRLAEVFFQKANETVASLSLPLWKAFNNGFRSCCRALRHDLAEIRRREEGRIRRRGAFEPVPSISGSMAGRHPASPEIRLGLDFLIHSQAPRGDFPLSASPHEYMCPSKSLAPSRSVTTLILRSLEPIKDLDPSVSHLLRRACRRLCDGHPGLPPGLPARLEGAFAPMPSARNRLSRLDRSFTPTVGPMPDGLFWANLLYTCSRSSFHPVRLRAFVTDCVLRRFYAPWSQGVAFGPVTSPWTRCSRRPLLPLLLFCQALGTELPRRALQDYLLAPHRNTGSWNDTTEISLILLCLMLSDYDGPELVPAIQKLSESQEADGSWAPNAFYQERGAYYGSRELTTAWCLEALHRFHLRASNRSRSFPGSSCKSSWTAPARARRPLPLRIALHPGLHDSVGRHARTAVRRARHWLASVPLPEVFMGRWPGMPAHFLLPGGPSLHVGINLLSVNDLSLFSIAKRPVPVEIILALALSARYHLCGPLQHPVEHVHVAGLAFCASRRLWPDASPWAQAGMDKPEWLWCQAHERFLREELGRLPMTPCTPQPLFQWLQTGRDLGWDDTIPKGATLYLGLSLIRRTTASHPERDLLFQLGKPVETVRKDVVLFHGI